MAAESDRVFWRTADTMPSGMPSKAAINTPEMAR